MIDFILTFEDDVKEKKKWSPEERNSRKKKREEKRQLFFENLEKKGMLYEVVEPKVIYVYED